MRYQSIAQERSAWMNRSLWPRGWLQATMARWASGCYRNGTAARERLAHWKTEGCWKTKSWGASIWNCFIVFFYVWTYLDFSTSLCLNYWKSGGFYSWFNHLQPRNLDSYEISLNFLDSPHQGDKRKKSQQCFLVISGQKRFVVP